jgi:ABC-type iron transport system FetAB ATPase subunit
MEFGELKYDDHDHTTAVEWLFKINDDLELLGKEVSKFSGQEMAQRIIPKNLKTTANLRYYDKCDNELHNKEDIIELCRRISIMLKQEVFASCDNRDNRMATG